MFVTLNRDTLESSLIETPNSHHPVRKAPGSAEDPRSAKLTRSLKVRTRPRFTSWGRADARYGLIWLAPRRLICDHDE